MFPVSITMLMDFIKASHSSLNASTAMCFHGTIWCIMLRVAPWKRKIRSYYELLLSFHSTVLSARIFLSTGNSTNCWIPIEHSSIFILLNCGNLGKNPFQFFNFNGPVKIHKDGTLDFYLHWDLCLGKPWTRNEVVFIKTTCNVKEVYMVEFT